MVATNTRQITTAEQLWEAADLGPCELVKGELIPLSPTGGRHSRIAARIALRLGAHVETHQLGAVYTAEPGFIVQREPDSVLAPDVAFISSERLPEPEPIRFFEIAPDLAVEVLSPSDRPGRTREKTNDWLDAGCRLLWIVDPEKRSVAVHRPGREAKTLNVDDTLDGGEVVPGFYLPVMQIFP